MRRIFVLIGICFLSGTFSSCDKIAKKVILKSTEEATETASKKLLRESLEKSTSKNLLEKGLKKVWLSCLKGGKHYKQYNIWMEVILLN